MSITEQDLYLPMKFLTSSKQIPMVNYEFIGTRPEPVVPDGVWIEIQGNTSSNKAVVNAVKEEKRICDMLQSKSERLKQFQENLQKRVKEATKAHRRFMAESQNIKMEKERELLLRSASAAEVATLKKNRCSYNVNPMTVIDGSGNVLSSLNLSSQDQADPMLHINEDVSSTCLVEGARKKLAQKTIIPKSTDSPEKLAEESNQLPGGLWGVGATRDICIARIYDKVDGDEINKLSDEDSSIETVSAASGSDDVILASLQESITSSLAASQKRLQEINKSCSFVTTEDQPNSEPETAPLKANVQFQLSHQPTLDENVPILVRAADDEQPPDIVTTSLPSNAVHCDARHKNSRHSNVANDKGVNGYLRQTTAAGAPPLVNPGVFAHNLKLADERAKWMSRRVFADAERERSREHARWKQHQQKVSKLREAKERERAEIEDKSREQVEAVERANEQLKLEVEKREKCEQRKEEKKRKKQKTDRFVSALYSRLRERISQHKIELPPLCMCGATFWGTHPNTCATNCLFHRNPRAYAKALEAVLAAVERNAGPIHKDLLQKSAVTLGLVDEDMDQSDLPSARSTDRSVCLDLVHRFSHLAAAESL